MRKKPRNTRNRGNKRIGKLGPRPNWAASYLAIENELQTDFLGNPHACTSLAAIVATQIERGRFDFQTPAPKVLIVGPPSSGKTFLAELIRRHLSVPTAWINFGVTTGEGYRGANLSDALRELVDQPMVHGKNPSERSSLVIMDEVCKIIRRGTKNDDWSSQLQFASLALLNGERILVPPGDSWDSPRYFDSKNTMVLAMGVFPGVRSSAWSNPDSARLALLKYGFCAEWISRITHFITLDPVRPSQLKELIAKEAKEIAKAYSTGVFAPAITPTMVSRLAAKTSASPFGFRVVRGLIHEAFAQQASESAVEDMFAP